jgi:hypothetical protein
MRRSMALLCVLALGMLIPAAVSAGKPFRETDHTVFLVCEGVTDTSGSWFAYIDVGISDLYGSFGFIDAWHEDDTDDIPDISSGHEASVTATWDGTSLSGTIPVVDGNGDPLGDATFSAALTPLGEPFSFDDTFRDGNARERYRGVSQAFQPEGTLTLPGGITFDLAECFANETTATAFLTDPTARVRSYSQRFVGCELTDTAGNDGYLYVDLGDEFVFVDAGFSSADGTTQLAASSFVEEAPASPLQLSLEVYDPETGEPTGDTAQLDMTVTSTGETYSYVLQAATGKRIERGELLDIEGSLEIGGSIFDLGACIGVDSRGKDIVTQPRGPKPGGQTVANDLPSGATPLRAGGSARLQTRGASPDAEVAFDCLTFTDPETGEVFETPVGHTVWYRFTGTGEPMTIDTAGSDFDTVVAVYTRSDGTYIPVPDGCVDDVPVEPVGRTLQAAVTIPTVAGTTYYVQIGGFPDVQSYGNLRVSLR